MKPTVHILATVRKPELLDAALLVFRTLRVGFPSAQVKVWGNGLNDWNAAVIAHAADQCGAEFRNLEPTSHDAWIESLMEESLAPFWICDTDMVFWEPVEQWFSVTTDLPKYAGRFEPMFNEEWTGTLHVQRLHTCLMWIQPAEVRMAMAKFRSRIPAPWGHVADFPFIRQHIIPRFNQKPLFYDTCAGLYHAADGRAFSEEQNACFEHLHCATYADALENKAFQEMHQRVYQDTNAARGIRAHQDKYYASRGAGCQLKRKELHAV
jgi:hypothetical protein